MTIESNSDSRPAGALPRSSVCAAAAAVAVAATLLLAACGAPPHHGPPPAEKVPSVGYIVVEAQKVALTTELPGRIAPVLVSEVRPQVTGLIQSRNFIEGSEVKKGTILYQIDPAPYRSALDSSLATLAKAQSTLRLARIKAARYQELAAIRAVSQQDFDDADAAVQQALADVSAAQAACETSRINLNYTRITAPFSGRIGRSSVTPGALVTANQTAALATLQKLDPVYVDLTQSSAAILALRRTAARGGMSVDSAGLKVQLLLEDGSAYPLAGRLEFSDVTVDQSTGAVTVRALFPNPRAELLPGMYVRAIVTEAIDAQAMLVPQQAITRDATGAPRAFVVGVGGTLEARPLALGRAMGDRWVVDAGLAPGDRLVVEGAQKARPGAAVAPIPLDEAPMRLAQRTPADPSGELSPVAN
jgi:membrane fusion protein (multidrug efflux system)